MKLRNLLIVSIIQGAGLLLHAQPLQSNIAYADRHVRFTVISDGALRMEYAPQGTFTDDRSFLAVERSYPHVDYQVKSDGAWVEVCTSKMKLRYKKNSGAFNEHNLSVTSTQEIGKFAWHPGLRQTGNLKGTYRTLDGYDGDSRGDTGKMPLEDGLLATDGWTLIDDSQNFLYDHSDWPWVRERPRTNGQDWYFMGYGHDYKAALKDFTRFAGKVPLPPRFAFGYWWSRYWSYSDRELRDLIRHFKTYGIPLDVLVIDMDWHYTEPGKGGWTGWTWNRRLFPDPQRLLSDLHADSLKVTINLHPADGIAPYEEAYPNMARDLGIDPATRQTIPWVNSDKRMISAVFKNILTPMEHWGIDFWWLDWQQDLYDPQVPRLSNTWWINYTFFSQMERNRNTRPMLYHRWGGLGNHRYQIGFSGDAIISWKSLDFQPYFNSTASNVLYGYWSHDLGGHMGADRIDPEMYVRWLQFGALSPIMRTHSTKSAGLNKEPWTFDKEHADIIRRTIRRRYELAPYIYTMARKDYDDALSLCRPMYYDYPESREAYDFKNEYMFGDELLVAPVTAPMTDGYARTRVWLPAGNDWYEWHTGTTLKGGQTVERSFALDEYPLYVKAGAVIPMYTDRVMRLGRNDEDVFVTVFPGNQGSFSLYEDNGNDRHYATDYARTPLSNAKEGQVQRITIGRREGRYAGMPERRRYTVKVCNALPPKIVTVNGKETAYTYQGEDLSVCIPISETSCSVEKIIRIEYPATVSDSLLAGIYGQSRRIAKALEALKYRDAGIVLLDELGNMGSVAEGLTYNPSGAVSLLERFADSYRHLPEVLTRQGLSEENRKWFLQAIDWQP